MAGRRFAIEQRAVGHGDHAGAAVDRESSAGVIVQRVGDRVVGRVGVGGQGRHTDHRAVGGVFIDRVGGRVTVGDRSDVEFIDIVDRDREDPSLERSVGRGGPHRDDATGPVRFAVDRPGHGDDAGGRVDREPAAVVVVQRVGDRVGAVGVVGEGGHADRRSDRSTFSSTASAAPSLSTIGVAPNSETSVTLIVKPWVLDDPSLLVARTIML